jgi:hypothetical protein
MQNESWPRLLGRLVLALLAAGSAIAGLVFRLCAGPAVARLRGQLG